MKVETFSAGLEGGGGGGGGGGGEGCVGVGVGRTRDICYSMLVQF